MGYKMNGFSGFGNSPAKKKIDPDAPGTPGKPGYEPEVKSMDYLTKTPNPTTKAVDVDYNKTLEAHLDDRTPNAPTDIQMENKGDFNISNLHKDTKMSLNKKKKKKHPLGIEDPAELEELYKKTENPNNKRRQ